MVEVWISCPGKGPHWVQTFQTEAGAFRFARNLEKRLRHCFVWCQRVAEDT